MKKFKELIHNWIWVVLLAFCIIGLIYPVIGVIALICMLAPSLVAIWRGRMWCGNFCPRGSFNDFILTKVSRNKAVPKLLRKKWFRYLFFSILMAAFAVQLILSWGSMAAIGSVFVRMIIITTLLTILLGVIYSSRTWCVICPMGTMAAWVTKFRIGSKNSTNKNVTFIKDKCVNCRICNKSCPMGIDVLSYKADGAVNNIDCIKCNKCVYKCPKNSLTAVK